MEETYWYVDYRLTAGPVLGGQSGFGGQSVTAYVGLGLDFPVVVDYALPAR